MNDKISTRDHNVDVLSALGFDRVQNTTIFKKGDQFILSPAVSESTNGTYWFDVREVNLNRISNDSLLLVRIVPNLFIIENLKKIPSLFSKQIMDNRPNSGNVWGIHIKINKISKNAFLFNVKKSNNKILTRLLNREEIIDYFKS